MIIDELCIELTLQQILLFQTYI